MSSNEQKYFSKFMLNVFGTEFISPYHYSNFTKEDWIELLNKVRNEARFCQLVENKDEIMEIMKYSMYVGYTISESFYIKCSSLCNKNDYDYIMNNLI